MARPTKLTPELQERICGLIAEGNFATTACKACGVALSTFYEWRKRGEQGEEPYADFLDAVNAADALSERGAVAVVKSAIRSDPKLALAFLARRHPHNWERHPNPS